MKKVILAAVTGATLLLAATCAAAAGSDIKVGVVDLQQVMQKSTQISAINNQLTKQFQSRQDKILSAQKALQAEIDQLNRNGSTMSETDRNKLQDKVVADRSSVQSQMLSFQRDVNTAQNDAMKKFMAQLTTIVTGIAKNGNYDLILQRAGVPFVKSELDVTAQVIDGLNKKA